MACRQCTGRTRSTRTWSSRSGSTNRTLKLTGPLINLLSVEHLELDACVGEGLTQASEGIVLKTILGYTFGAETEMPTRTAKTR